MNSSAMCRAVRHLVLITSTVILTLCCLAQAATVGIPISYQLPTTGPLPKTYRVTLAIVDQKNPNWIISTFDSGAVRTVTQQNQGKFTETWDGLDENFMPVPPGAYGVKGIVMPAQQWAIDGQYHTLTAKLNGGPFCWLPRPDQDTTPSVVHGDPVNSPPGDIATAPNGRAVFYWVYLENGTNNFLIDLNKPIGPEQIISGYGSGGAAGGVYTATDGETVWSFCADGNIPFIYRADGKPFGAGKGRWRNNVYIPDGAIAGLTAWRDTATAKSYVFLAERGKLEYITPPSSQAYPLMRENAIQRLNRILVLDGNTAAVVATVPINEPMAITARNGKLYAMSRSDGKCLISRVALDGGLPKGNWQPVATIQGIANPTDFEVDAHERLYVCDADANQVYRLNADGTIAKTFGRTNGQQPGHYDPLTFMHPNRLATWTDPQGNDRLIVMENVGPCRIAEWSPDGQLLRTWQTLQPHANFGYTYDPDHPEDVYVGGVGDWMTRFKVDYQTGTWTIDAVWPNISAGQQTGWGYHGIGYPKIVNVNGRKYMTFGRGYAVYRFAGDQLLASAGIIRETDKQKTNFYLWHDANGDGLVQEAEYRDQPLDHPQGVFGYWGDDWQSDLSLIAIGEGTRDIWRLAPTGFDTFGNPLFTGWQKLLTDPVMAAKAAGTADLIHGGNEVSDVFNAAWRSVVGTPQTGFLVDARGGSISANVGAEQKLTRYVPNTKGGYDLLWRVGRSAYIHSAPGAIVGSIHTSAPIYNLIGLIDQTRAGCHIFTADEGLYVDTVMLEGQYANTNIYGSPGEFFAGQVLQNKDNGKVYLVWGKYTPMLFEIQGWTQNTPIQHITTLPKTVTITAKQIADPVEAALRVRGGAGKAKAVRFLPHAGGSPALDGSMNGWEACEPVQFADGASAVEVRCEYDPETIYLRWQVRSESAINIRPLFPAERIFTHDRGADTMGFYLQCDPNATGKAVAGRPGDVRIIFGLFDDKGAVRPVALGLYPKWTGNTKGAPITYGSPMGTASFEHAGVLSEVHMGYQLDPDKKGLVLAAAIPRSVLPAVLPSLTDNLRTLANFDVNFGGNKKFWWANADGSANRETNDEPTEARLYPGCWAQAQFVPLGAELPIRSWQACGPWGGEEMADFTQGDKNAVSKFFDAMQYPLDNHQVDLKATYTGPQTKVHLGGKAAGLTGVQRLRWQLYSAEGTDTFVNLGTYARLWFAASWVYAPEEMTVEANTFVYKQNRASVWVNDQKLKEAPVGGLSVPVAKQPVTLHQGWNQIFYRGYTVGYELRFGMTFSGTPEQLWQLRCSPTPPQQ